MRCLCIFPWLRLFFFQSEVVRHFPIKCKSFKCHNYNLRTPVFRNPKKQLKANVKWLLLFGNHHVLTANYTLMQYLLKVSDQ